MFDIKPLVIKSGYPGFVMDQLLSILNNDRTFCVDGTVTNDTYINSESVVTLLKILAERFTDLPITHPLVGQCPLSTQCICHDRGGTPRDYLAMASPTFSPNLNLIECEGGVSPRALLSVTWAVQASDYECLADTSGRHQAKLNTLLTLNFQVFKSAA